MHFQPLGRSNQCACRCRFDTVDEWIASCLCRRRSKMTTFYFRLRFLRLCFYENWNVHELVASLHSFFCRIDIFVVGRMQAKDARMSRDERHDERWPRLIEISVKFSFGSFVDKAHKLKQVKSMDLTMNKCKNVQETNKLIFVLCIRDMLCVRMRCAQIQWSFFIENSVSFVRDSWIVNNEKTCFSCVLS